MFAFFFASYDWLMIPGLLLGLYAQFKLTSTYRRYLEEPVQTGLSGAEAAREILDRAGLTDVPVEMVPGHLTDHYDPMKRALFLSEENFRGRSVAAVGVAAHETGHALQHKEAYAPLQFRMMLAPATNFASVGCWIILGVGALLSMAFHIIPISLYAKMLPIAIGLFMVVTLFQLITLPVEYDASRRAKHELDRLGLIAAQEASAVREMLHAAALTYVAALVSSVMEMVRWMLISRDLNDR